MVEPCDVHGCTGKTLELPYSTLFHDVERIRVGKQSGNVLKLPSDIGILNTFAGPTK